MSAIDSNFSHSDLFRAYDFGLEIEHDPRIKLGYLVEYNTIRPHRSLKYHPPGPGHGDAPAARAHFHYAPAALCG